MGAPAEGTLEEKRKWTRKLLLSADGQEWRTLESEVAKANENGWGGGDERLARIEMGNAMKEQGSKGGKFVYPKLPNLTAPGNTGERPEHLRCCLDNVNVRGRRRLWRVLDGLRMR